MSRPADNPVRSIGLSATAIVTMVALAAIAPTWSVRGVAAPQVRAVLGETDPVRVVAAAVVAAARELVRVDQAVAAVPAHVSVLQLNSSAVAAVTAAADPPVRAALIETVLDLPPPCC